MRTLCVLLWRNLIVTKRKPFSFAYQMIFPLLYLVLLHFLKDKLTSKTMRLNDEDAIKHTEEKFPEFTPSQPRCLLYTPNSDLAGSLMDEVGRQLGLFRLGSIPNPDEEAFEPCLGYYPFTNYYEIANLVSKFHTTEAVILFEDMDAESWSSRRHDSLTYTIRMKRNFSTHVVISHGDVFPKDHSDYGDVYEGFTRIQWAIDTSYIKIRSGQDVPQKLSLQEFPYYRLSVEKAMKAFTVAVILYFMYWADLLLTFQHVFSRMMIDRADGIQKLSLQEFPYYRQSEETVMKAFLVATLMYFMYWADLLLTFQHVFSRMMIDRADGIQELIKLNGVSVLTLGASYFISSLPPALVFAVASIIVVKIGDPAIIQHTSGLILLIGLVLYVFSVIACGMACSYLTHSSQYASTLAIFVYLGTVLFAYFVNMKTKLKPLVLATGLVLHIPLEWVLSEIATSEAFGKPLQFGDIGKTYSKMRCSVLVAYFFLILQTFIFLMITWYLSLVRQGKFGNSQPWNICLKKGFWTGKSKHPVNAAFSNTEVVDSGREEKYFEPPPKNIEVGIKIINVTKIYGKHIVLNNVSLDVYKGEITILLGHNGAGKTTLMSIMTGMIPATKGVVYVNGVDSRSHSHKLRKNIGLCPQHNLFLPHFNVLEHVVFFHLLKSKSTIKEARIKSMELLDQLGIGDKTKSKPEELSGGMKRRLQLACALTGGSDVLVLDEPTSGLDVQTRRELWNLVLGLRGGHTVLLSTHYMEEADALGDRIAAMHTGHLRGHATPMFLKKAMGSGYRLSITTTGVPKESEITHVIKSHVSDATVKEKTPKSITYNLPSSATSKFPALFAALEKDTQKRKCCILPPKDRRGVLGIATIGLGVTTLEEAFVTLCSDTDMVNEEEMDCTEASQRTLVSGTPLYRRQVVALLKRQFRFVRASWLYFLICNALIPLLLMYWFLGVTNNSKDNDMLSSTEPDLVVDLSMYHLLPERRVLLNVNTTLKVSRRLMHKYGDVMFSQSRNIQNDMIKIGKRNMEGYNNYLIGVELDDYHAKALYTTVHRHAAPAAVNLVSNTIASHHLAPPKDGRRFITVHNHPLNDAVQLVQATSPPSSQVKTVFLCCFWGIIVSCIISLINCNYVTQPARDGASGMRHIHVMAGCPAALHWLTTLVIHTNIVAVIMIPAVIFYAYFVDKDNTIGQPVLLIYVAIHIFLGTIAFLSLLYVLSLCFTERAAGVIGSMFAIAFGLLTPLVRLGADIMEEKFNFFLSAGLWITNFLMPPQTMTVGMSKAVYIGRLNALCKVNKINCPNIVVDNSPGFNTDKCCAGETMPYLYFNRLSPGIEILTMIAQGIVYMIIVVQIQQGYFNRLYDRVRNKNFQPDVQSSQDELVSDESKYVASEIKLNKTMIKEDDEALLVNDLHKNYPPFLRKRMYAVKGISFSVKRGECFGLLGTNGAGKSTTFKMLTSEVCPTRGTIYANRYFLHEDKYEYLRTIGYCPQFHGIDEFQTGSDNMRTLLSIRGLDDEDIDTELEAWIDVIGLNRYKNTVASAYSGGYKRRLAAAVALCSGAPLSLLDEPTAGVDVGARRRVHSAFKKSLCQKRSIVITSHSMDEMESLCERIAIMVNGKIRALGTPAELRYRFAQGYAVILKITPYLTDSESSSDDKVEHLKNTMEKKFDCELRDEHMTMLHYHIDDKISYSELFQQLELIRSSYVRLIEDYSVSETTLEEVFLLLAKEEREEVESQDGVTAECGMLSCIGNKDLEERERFVEVLVEKSQSSQRTDPNTINLHY